MQSVPHFEQHLDNSEFTEFREKWSINQLEEPYVFELSQDMSQTWLGTLYQICKGLICSRVKPINI